ncbi:hypothetical protein J0H33_03165 [bacterium]|nr:hypothetical protein [bacterium]
MAKSVTEAMPERSPNSMNTAATVAQTTTAMRGTPRSWVTLPSLAGSAPERAMA